MKKLFLLALFALLMAADVFPQGWSDTPISLGTGIGAPFKAFTNKNGHHVIRRFSGRITYSLYNFTGTLIRTSQVEASQADGVCGINNVDITGNDNDIYIFYTASNHLIIKKSTNAGAAWSVITSPTSAYMEEFAIDIDAYKLYLVWRSGQQLFSSIRYLNGSSWTGSLEIEAPAFYDDSSVPIDLEMAHNSNNLFLSYSVDQKAYIQMYDQVGDVWEAYESKQINGRIWDISIDANSSKLFLCMWVDEPFIGSGTRGMQIWSRPQSGGSWILENTLSPTESSIAVTPNGQVHILYGYDRVPEYSTEDPMIQYASYNPSIGWSSPRILFYAQAGTDERNHALTIYGNNLYAFYNDPMQQKLSCRVYNGEPIVPTGLTAKWGTMTQVPELSWTPNPETNISLYEIWAKDDYITTWQFVKTSTSAQFTDAEFWNGGITYYKVRAKNSFGLYSDFSSQVKFTPPSFKDNATADLAEVSAPTEYAVSQNYPNPFNPSTIINYDIPNASMVSLKVYDMLGREVAELVNEHKEAGRYQVAFDASHLSTGIYIYQLRANEYISVKKMNFVK